MSRFYHLAKRNQHRGEELQSPCSHYEHKHCQLYLFRRQAAPGLDNLENQNSRCCLIQNFFIRSLLCLLRKRGEKGDQVSVRLIIFPAQASHVDRKFQEELSRCREEMSWPVLHQSTVLFLSLCAVPVCSSKLRSSLFLPFEPCQVFWVAKHGTLQLR